MNPLARVYLLYLPGFARLMIALVLSAFTLIGILMVAGIGGEPQSRIFGAVWLCVVGLFWFKVLTIPHRIEVLPDGLTTFVSIARRIQVSPLDVESIKPVGNQIGFFVLRHAGGRIVFIGQFDGFHEFLSNLKASNPRVELRGC